MTKIYSKNVWVDEILAGDELYDILDDEDNPIHEDVQIQLTTDVAQAGSAVDADKMNNIEDGLDAIDTLVDGSIAKSLFDANTVLAANADDTPAPVTIAEQTVLGRITDGNIKGLSIAELQALINLSNYVTKALFDANTILAANENDTPAAVTIAEQQILGRITNGNIKGLSVAELKTLLNLAGYAPMVSNITKTVGADKDYATIQEAINYFMGKTVSGTCTIAVDAGTYAENLTFASIQIMPGATLWLKGDTRTLAGLTYVDHTHGANSEDRTNGGSTDAACALATSVNDITVTVTGTDPDFNADSWVNGDKLLVYDNAGAITEKTINSTSNKTISLTAAAPTVGGSGSAVALCPNRIISLGDGTGITVNITGVTISGFYIKSSVATGYGININIGASAVLQNILVRKFYASIAIISGQAYATVGCMSSWEAAAYGFQARLSGYSSIHYLSIIKCTLYGIFNEGGDLLYSYRSKAVGCSIGYWTSFNSCLYLYANSAINNTTGFYATSGGFIDATSSNARSTGNGTLSATDGLTGSYVLLT
jgi:hypothetical protein